MLISRITGPAIGAAFMATALGLVMVKLIHVEFEAEQEHEPIAIYLETKETTLPKPIVIHKPKTYQKIDVPPRIEAIKVDDVSLPTEEPFDPSKVKRVKLDRPEIELRKVDTATIDKEAQPIQRVVAKVPRKALEVGLSGHCRMRFNVDTRGNPFDVVAYHCSHKMFEKNAIEATRKFRYLAKIRDGAAVDMIGVETKITYKVKDERGRILPES